MEDFYINNTSVDESYNNSNVESNNTTHISIIKHYDIMKLVFIMEVVLCIIISIGLPLTLLAIYHLYSQVRNDHVAPIYIINLFISDIIQFCCTIVYVTKPENYMIIGIFNSIHLYGLMVSVGFMMCIALERYLVIAWPLWYRFTRNIKTSVVVSVVVWTLPFLFLFFRRLIGEPEKIYIINAAFFFLPLPLFIFSLFGTIKALSAAISVPPDEKRRIVAILVLVLLIYTLLFLPAIICFLTGLKNDISVFVSFLLVRFSPLGDLFLYVFSRKGAVDKFLACVCRCRKNSDSDISMNDISSM